MREMLLYTAELKCSLKESLAKKKRRVDQLLETLALERCAATMIGDSLARGISGGQACIPDPHALSPCCPCVLPAYAHACCLLLLPPPCSASAPHSSLALLVACNTIGGVHSSAIPA